jgi:hypothetical protein
MGLTVVLRFGLFQEHIVIMLNFQSFNFDFECTYLSSYKMNYLLRVFTDRLVFLICFNIYSSNSSLFEST